MSGETPKGMYNGYTPAPKVMPTEKAVYVDLPFELYGPRLPLRRSLSEVREDLEKKQLSD